MTQKDRIKAVIGGIVPDAQPYKFHITLENKRKIFAEYRDVRAQSA